MPSKNAPTSFRFTTPSKYRGKMPETPPHSDTEEESEGYQSPCTSAHASPPQEFHRISQLPTPRTSQTCQNIQGCESSRPVVYPSIETKIYKEHTGRGSSTQQQCSSATNASEIPICGSTCAKMQLSEFDERNMSPFVRQQSSTEQRTGCCPTASSPAALQAPNSEQESKYTGSNSPIPPDLWGPSEQPQASKTSFKQLSEGSPKPVPLTTKQLAHNRQKMHILPSLGIPHGLFNLLALPIEVRYVIYDHVALSQTFMVTSQNARGSTFTNLSHTSKVVWQEIESWAKGHPQLIPGFRGGLVDFNNTTFLVDFWTDRLTVSPQIIGSRFHALSAEKICSGRLKNLCVDLTTDSQQGGPQAVLEFLKSLHGTLHEFVRLRQLTIVYDSGDESVKSDWFLRKRDGWTGEYERKEGFLRTVWRMLPAALGVCHWSYPCTCCAPSWKIEVNGFDMRKGEWEELKIEQEMYAFVVSDGV